MGKAPALPDRGAAVIGDGNYLAVFASDDRFFNQLTSVDRVISELQMDPISGAGFVCYNDVHLYFFSNGDRARVCADGRHGRVAVANHIYTARVNDASINGTNAPDVLLGVRVRVTPHAVLQDETGLFIDHAINSVVAVAAKVLRSTKCNGECVLLDNKSSKRRVGGVKSVHVGVVQAEDSARSGAIQDGVTSKLFHCRVNLDAVVQCQVDAEISVQHDGLGAGASVTSSFLFSEFSHVVGTPKLTINGKGGEACKVKVSNDVLESLVNKCITVFNGELLHVTGTQTSPLGFLLAAKPITVVATATDGHCDRRRGDVIAIPVLKTLLNAVGDGLVCFNGDLEGITGELVAGIEDGAKLTKVEETLLTAQIYHRCNLLDVESIKAICSGARHFVCLFLV